MSSNFERGKFGGYSITYSHEDTYFPIYVMAALVAVFLGLAWAMRAWYWLPFAGATAAFTYYNLPLLETGRRPSAPISTASSSRPSG